MTAGQRQSSSNRSKAESSNWVCLFFVIHLKVYSDSEGVPRATNLRLLPVLSHILHINRVVVAHS